VSSPTANWPTETSDTIRTSFIDQTA
jgi:hypothetical protein